MYLSNGDLMLSFYEQATASATSIAPFSMISTDDGATWGSAVALTHSFTSFGGIESPVVELDNGDLLAPLFGKDTGDTYQSVRLSKSTDGGASWAHYVDVVDGDTFGRNMQEPNILRLDNGDLFMMIRSDGSPDQIYSTTSTDDGATWSSMRLAFVGKGKPSLWQRSSDGCMFVTLRSAVGEDSVFRASQDRGQSWSLFERMLSTNKFEYAGWAEDSAGEVVVVFSSESSTTDADLRFARIA